MTGPKRTGDMAGRPDMCRTNPAPQSVHWFVSRTYSSDEITYICLKNSQISLKNMHKVDYVEDGDHEMGW